MQISHINWLDVKAILYLGETKTVDCMPNDKMITPSTFQWITMVVTLLWFIKCHCISSWFKNNLISIFLSRAWWKDEIAGDNSAMIGHWAGQSQNQCKSNSLDNESDSMKMVQQHKLCEVIGHLACHSDVKSPAWVI